MSTKTSMTTWFTVYSHFVEPLRGPMFRTKSPYPDILPPDIRVLLGRPKRYWQKDVVERVEEDEKKAAEKSKKMQAEGVSKALRKGIFIHCKICGAVAHNARTCPWKPTDGGS
ncbi:hypothetical protein LIER_36191 [Lithospermum erythrorhizon]|uniref:Uncharacterized protein n=1 Tax=Lithospermum erythrorhizon TaxID=34254 RepID=A0AAV3P2A7_LITER